MGLIQDNVKLILTILGIITLIQIFPETLCIPLTTQCVFLEPLHNFRIVLNYGIAVLIFFALIAGSIVALIETIRFIRANKQLQYLIAFLVTFEHKNWVRFRKSLT